MEKTMERMRYILCLVLFALAGAGAVRADLRVKSFSELNDLDARLLNPIVDPKTGQNCPIVKIITTYDGFNFDIGAMGAPEKVVYKKEMGEIWLYLPVKSAKLKIAHPRYGQFIDDANTRDGYYWFPQARLKSSTSYRLVLEVSRGAIELDDEDRVKTGWMAVTSEPSGAEVYISPEGQELQFVGTTPFTKKYPYGTYAYSIRKNMYHSNSGIAVLEQDKISENFVLSPAFGKVHVTSTPAGARVTIDGGAQEYITPFTTGELKSGDYSFRFLLDKYTPTVRTVTVTDGITAELAVELSANFSAVTINTLPGAQISINGAVAGTGSMVQELGEGIYDIEATLAHHKPVKRQVEVAANVPQTLELKPTPIYGSLDVTSTPFDADITIDGKSYGKTPLTIERLLEGEYDVVLSKPGCATVTRHVAITEKQTASIEATLPQGRRVNFTGTVGASVMVDDEFIGTVPCSAMLTIGNHQVFASLGDEKEAHVKSETLTVQQGMGEMAYKVDFADPIGIPSKTIVIDARKPGALPDILSPRWSSGVTAKQRAVLGRLVENMVRVQGGTFVMGATSEQGTNARADEKPTHKVVLGDYYIGKYEVTQAEWEAVTGKNPSFFRGENRPVECVSWQECQEFLKKLNELTGLQFALPTEAQWEFAARGGNKSRGSKYSGSNHTHAVAWCATESGSETHPVGTKQPNELGLYDMSGNVWEWCGDWYAGYSSGSQTNPTGPASGWERVRRGGEWGSDANACRVSHRFHYNPHQRTYSIGLRLVAIAP